MRKILYTIIVVLCMACTLGTMAKDGNKIIPRVYVFGMSTSFNDSTVFFTDIMTLDSVFEDGKSGFIIGRDNYSLQLRYYLEDKVYSQRTCVFVSGKDQKHIMKKYEKMKSRYAKKGGSDILLIDKSEFAFTPISITSLMPVEK